MNPSTEEVRMICFIATITLFGAFVLWAGISAKPNRTEQEPKR